MNTFLKSICFVTFIIPMASFAATPVIYGDDNRKDLFEITNGLYRQLADSTVALMKKKDLTLESPGMIWIKSKSLGEANKLCSSEPFFDQPTGAFCSGALVGKNLVLTAGHCIEDQDHCKKTQFIFGYDVNQAGVYPENVSDSQTYTCKKILHRQENDEGADFEIIQLDRAVPDHAVLKLADRSETTIEKGTALLMIGHPSGLPTKIDDGGSVRKSKEKSYFEATTDSFSGSSGAPVFNLRTGEIEGVLVRGDEDFVKKNGCYVSKHCSENGCDGEEITSVSSIARYIPSLNFL